MLNWALSMFIIALLAASLGFTGIALAFAAVARILFYAFLALFLLMLLVGVIRRA